jgi:protein-tyrosine phosphatase
VDVPPHQQRSGEMLGVFLILEILILVAPLPVKGLASNKPLFGWLSHVLLWRYSNLYLWRFFFVSAWIILFISSYFSSSKSHENLFIIWVVSSCLILAILTLLLCLNQTLSSLCRPLYLRSGIFLIFSILNSIFFLLGLIVLSNSLNWAGEILLILQGMETVSFVVICGTLAVTWYLGRPYHKPLSSPRDIETSESHPYAIDFISPELFSRFISSSSPLALGMSYLPGRCRSNYQRSLSDDLDRIQSFYQIDLVASLLPSYQLEEMQVANLENLLIERNLKYLIFGWRDKWIPDETTLRDLLDVVGTIVQNLRDGRRVLVHCFGGKGRTGVVIVAVLIRLGIPFPTAIDLIRTSRKGCIHNPLQLFYLNWINNYFISQSQ